MAFDNGKIVVRFATEAPEQAAGPLTWAHRYMWDIITSLAPLDEHLNLKLIVPIPAGPSIGDIAKAIAALIERHASLRTRYFVDDDLEPYQIEMSSGELELPLHTSVAGENPEQSSAELAKFLTGRSFDLTQELPVRAGICSHENGSTFIVLAFSHIVIDGWGMEVLKSDLKSLLSRGRDPGKTPGHRPIEQAAFENSESRRHIEINALAHWRSRLHKFPRTMFAMHPVAAASPRYWRGVLSSPALGLGVTALARRYRISSNSVLLAALSLYIGYYMGIDYCALNVQVSNRLGRDLRQAVGNFFQDVPVVFNIDQYCFEATAKSAHAEVIRSALHARCSPAKVRKLRDEIDEELGTRIIIDTNVNTIQLPTAQPPSVPEFTQDLSAVLSELRSRTKFSWYEKRAVEGVKMLVIASPFVANWISLLADTTYLPPDQVSALLLGIEELIIHIATVGDEPMTPVQRSSLVPFHRGPEWRKLGASWTDLEATASMISDRSGVSRDAIHLAIGNELIAYMVGHMPLDKFRHLPRDCFDALVQDENVALPDRFVLLEESPMYYPSDDGWRHLPVLETAALR